MRAERQHAIERARSEADEAYSEAIKEARSRGRWDKASPSAQRAERATRRLVLLAKNR